MSRILKTILWSGLAALSLTIVTPVDSQAADRYWQNYWRWYDNDYRPYYHRYNARRFDYDRDYRPDWDRGYYGNPRTARQYRYRPDYQYQVPRGGVDIGPLQLWW
ncbi:MAG: hypothetical protein ACYC6N_08785 [Pirellulaceae bacterium]